MVQVLKLTSLGCLVVSSFILAASSCNAAAGNLRHHCTCIPGDDCWPQQDDWNKLNSTVRGKLIATDPAASICHGERYDELACETLKQEWDFPQPHIFNSGEIMSPFWQNQSCDPFTDKRTNCTLGNYVSYSIAVDEPEDVRSGIEFAARNNIRLVIKNTGHDYLGRSTGKGGLGLWMQGLNSTKVLPHYTSKHYSGPALVVGAGVLSADAYAAVHKHGLRVVGGGCPSVGIAGGYTQGGGHSFLTSKHGLSADNVLEWEVMTAAGDHVVATPDNEYADLYWALSGGGGGNYAVVISMTVRAHQDSSVGGAYLAFDASMIGNDRFWGLVAIFHTLLPSAVDRGATALYQITDGKFVLLTLTAPGLTQSQVTNLLSPLTKALDETAAEYTFVPTVADSFYDHFAASFGPLPFGPIPVSDIISSRLIPRSVVAENSERLGRTFRSIVEGQNFYVGIAALSANSTGWSHPPNAVLPAWRSTLLQCVVGSPWDWSLPREKMEARTQQLMTQIVPALEALTPGSGTYMNEGNADQVGWKKEFFGENYNTLFNIKKKYDPRGLFFGATAVGSELFSFDKDGRLCSLLNRIGTPNGEVTSALTSVRRDDL